MPEFHFFSTLQTPVIVLGAVLACLLSIFAYRFTVPPVSRLLRSLLATLRALGLFLVFVLIGEPLLSLISRHEEPPLTAVLLDNSRSMSLRDKDGDRGTILKRVLTSPALQELRSVGSVLYGSFDTKLRLLESISPDSLSLAGVGTDLGAAFTALRDTAARSNLRCVVIVTDGNSTEGTSPVYEAEDLGVPVFTVGVGDTSEQQDVLIRKVITNSVTYVGNKLPVDITVRSSGYGEQKVEIILRDGAKIADRRILTLQGGTRDYSISLTMVPEREGTQKIVVEVSQLPNEVSVQNNRFSVYTRVLKSRMQVLLLAGSPSPDVAFIRRALESDKNIELKTLTERGNGQFYEGQLTADVLQPAEAIILVGYPVKTTSSASISAIIGAAGEGKGLFFVLSRTTDFGRLQSLEPLLPVNLPPVPGEELQAFLAVPVAQRSNALLRTKTSEDLWAKLPPLFAGENRFRAKPESEILGLRRIQSVVTGDPLLVIRNVNRRRSVALLGYGIWRWKAFSGSVVGAEHLLEEFFSNAVRWLTTREEDRPVRVQPVKQAFAGNDPVEFTAQVYDKNFNPVDDAEVSVTVKQADKSDLLNLEPIGNGRFEGALPSLPEGEYTFAARVVAGDQQIGEDSGSFSVGGVNLEFQETRMNRSLLELLAARTGGRYYNAKGLDSLPKDIAGLPSFRARQVLRSSELDLRNKGWVLAALVLIFASEWFLRKRNGML